MTGRRLSIVLAVAAAVLVTAPAVRAEDGSWRKRMSATFEEFTDDDVSEERRFGREIAARILGRLALLDDENAQQYVNLVGSAVAGQSARPEIAFRFAIVRSDTVNAYSAPGGYIFVTTAAVKAMENEAELAGVLAHEIAHVTERHIVRELNIYASDVSPASGFARLIGAGTETARVAFLQAVDKAIDILFKDGYKREQELDSDRVAAELCVLAGYDPRGLRWFLKRMEAKGGETPAGTTHPLFSERFAAFDRVLTGFAAQGAAGAQRPARFAVGTKGMP